MLNRSFTFSLFLLVACCAAINNLYAQNIVVSPEHYDFGPVREGQSAEVVLTISNAEDSLLVIDEIEGNHEVLTHNFEGGEITLARGEEFELTVTFAPIALGYPSTAIIVHSNDPDSSEYMVHITGTGSRAEGYYDFYISENNHSVLVTFTMGGEPAGLGDEVGLFTPNGLCAGSRFVREIGARLGIPAFSDDSDSEFLCEGFADGEQIQFRVYDFSQDREYAGEEIDIEIISGRLSFSVGGRTWVNLNVLVAIRPVPDIHITEGDEVEFELEVIDPPDDWELRFLNQDEIEGMGEWNLAVDGNVGSFTWQTNRFAGNIIPHILNFAAVDPDTDFVPNFTDVYIYAMDIADTISINEELKEEIFDWDRELNAWVFTVEEDADWTVIIPNLDDFFIHPEDAEMEYIISCSAEQLAWEVDEESNSYRVRMVEENWNGRIEVLRIVADALRGGEWGDTVFVHDLMVQPVNDSPLIIDEEGVPYDNEVSFSINEAEVWVFNVQAIDADNAASDLDWSVIDQGDLPEGWEFTDHHDGSADFTWTPDVESGRRAPYRLVIGVTDPEGGADTLQLDITVRDLSVGESLEPPATFRINAIYPNPFNSATTISFGLPMMSNVEITAWDISGRCIDHIFSGQLNAGHHAVTWKPESTPSGIYILSLRMSDKQFLRKVLFVK